ncbi:hypothetical protein HQ447_02675 [bacterium]|nr:hypothetical protein [bacterium]
MRVAAFVFLAFSPIGCANSNRPSATNAASTEWKIGDFGLRFQAGPRGQEDRSYSHDYGTELLLCSVMEGLGTKRSSEA